jgi:hypothetical protein
MSSGIWAHHKELSRQSAAKTASPRQLTVLPKLLGQPLQAGSLTASARRLRDHDGNSGPGVIRSAVEKTAPALRRSGGNHQADGFQDYPAANSRPWSPPALNVPFGIIDLSLAPTPRTGDSIANILENMGLESCGTHGTTAALALLTDSVKKGGLMACSHAGGLSGAFIPVSEDAGMIEAVKKGSIGLDKLEP